MEYVKFIWFVFPILAAVISAKRFNWFHGIVVFIFTTFIFLGVTDLLVNLSVWDLTKTQDFVSQTWFIDLQAASIDGAAYIMAPYNIVTEVTNKISSDFDIVFLIGKFRWVVYSAALVLWIIFRAMAGKIKRR